MQFGASVELLPAVPDTWSLLSVASWGSMLVKYKNENGGRDEGLDIFPVEDSYSAANGVLACRFGGLLLATCTCIGSLVLQGRSASPTALDRLLPSHDPGMSLLALRVRARTNTYPSFAKHRLELLQPGQPSTGANIADT